jgi:dTDP-4-dehydrorhamnose reductase
MKWLITGASGQLGLALQEELKERTLDFVGANSSEMDVTKPLIVNQIVDLIKPNVIINAAAWTDVDGAESNEFDAYSVNSLGPQNLAIAASKIGARLVQISTDYVFSGDASSPWSENAPHNPQSVYGSTKSEGEKFVLTTLPLNSYVVRTAWLYSSKGKNFAKTMVNLALNQKCEIRVVNDQIGQPTFAGDLAKQIVELVLSEAPAGIYHGTNSGRATWFEFAQAIFSIAGADVSRVIPVSTSDFPSPAKRPTYSVLGHDAWANANVPPMQDWKNALEEAIPAIISALGKNAY